MCRDQQGEAKFRLEPEMELAQNWGLSDRRMKSALRLVQEHEDEIRSAWRRHFANRRARTPSKGKKPKA